MSIRKGGERRERGERGEAGRSEREASGKRAGSDTREATRGRRHAGGDTREARRGKRDAGSERSPPRCARARARRGGGRALSQWKSSPPDMYSSTMYSLSVVWNANRRFTRNGCWMFCRIERSVCVCASWLRLMSAALRSVFIAMSGPSGLPPAPFFCTSITLPNEPLPSTFTSWKSSACGRARGRTHTTPGRHAARGARRARESSRTPIFLPSDVLNFSWMSMSTPASPASPSPSSASPAARLVWSALIFWTTSWRLSLFAHCTTNTFPPVRLMHSSVDPRSLRPSYWISERSMAPWARATRAARARARAAEVARDQDDGAPRVWGIAPPAPS